PRPDRPGGGDRGRRWWRGRPTACRTNDVSRSAQERLALYVASRMTHPTRQTPADVIPLSPFRAELGRARRLRRADVLLAEQDLESAVRALPGDELYYVLHELDHEDARPILAAATADQLQVVLDFALWQRDRIAPDALAEWVEAR